MADREFIFVHNRSSGANDAQALHDLIESRMRDAGATYRFLSVREIDQLISRPDACAHATIVAVGGDGTVNSAARAALQLRRPFAIIAAGTFNFVARSNAIPELPEQAIDVLLHGQITPVQVGSVNGQPFLVNACIGLYAKVLREREQIKQTIGRSRAVAVLAAVLTALRPYRGLDIELRGSNGITRQKAATFFVGNNRLQLDLVGIEQADLAGNGQLLAVLLPRVGVMSLLSIIVAAALGRAGSIAQLVSFPLKTVQVDIRTGRRRRIRVAIDGELHEMKLPLQIGSMTEPLRLLCPTRPLPVSQPAPASIGAVT